MNKHEADCVSIEFFAKPVECPRDWEFWRIQERSLYRQLFIVSIPHLHLCSSTKSWSTFKLWVNSPGEFCHQENANRNELLSISESCIMQHWGIKGSLLSQNKTRLPELEISKAYYSRYKGFTICSSCQSNL